MSYAGPSWKKLSAIPAEGEANLLARRTRTREQSCSPVMLEPARNEARCNRRNTPPSFEPGSSRGVKGVTIFHVTTVGAPWNESGGGVVFKAESGTEDSAYRVQAVTPARREKSDVTGGVSMRVDDR